MTFDHESAEIWEPIIRRHELQRPGDRLVVIAGMVYAIQPDAPGSPFQGMAGRRFDIIFNNGTKITTRNLWYLGSVPEKYRSRLPDDARFAGGAGFEHLNGPLYFGGWNGSKENDGA